MNVEVDKILTWLRRESKQGNGLVSLTHQNVGGFGASLGKWPVSEEDPDAVLEQIAGDLFAAACDDADGQNAPGPQQYFAHFFGEVDLRNPASRLPFLVVPARQAALGPPGEGIATEPPTPSGFIGHVMRHSDAAQRQAWTITGHALGMIERHAAQVSQENGRLREANFELARGYEGLLSERHIRELAAQNAIHERHERSQFWNRMWLLAPAAMNKLFGGGAGGGGAPRALPPMAPRALPANGSPSPSGGGGAPPPAPHPGPGAAGTPEPPPPQVTPISGDSLLAVQLRALFDSFEPGQLIALQETLSAEQFVALGAVYQAITDALPPEDAPSPVPSPSPTPASPGAPAPAAPASEAPEGSTPEGSS